MEEEEDEEEEEEGGGGRSDYQWRQENWKNETCADSDIWNIREKEREKKKKEENERNPAESISKNPHQISRMDKSFKKMWNNSDEKSSFGRLCEIRVIFPDVSFGLAETLMISPFKTASIAGKTIK